MIKVTYLAMPSGLFCYDCADGYKAQVSRLHCGVTQPVAKHGSKPCGQFIGDAIFIKERNPV